MEPSTPVTYSETQRFAAEDLKALYLSVSWSSASKANTLQRALAGAHRVISAWDGQRLIGLGNAISDGALVVYFPHLLVHPEYQGHGIGQELMRRLQEPYLEFHQQVLVADGDAIEFYKKLGFRRAGRTEPLWIYDGHDH